MHFDCHKLEINRRVTRVTWCTAAIGYVDPAVDHAVDPAVDPVKNHSRSNFHLG